MRDGEPCSHPGCLSHISHPCEGCGRIGGHYMNKQYVIYNFINDFLEGYDDIGTPLLTCFHEDSIKFNLEDAKEHLSKLHSIGFTGLKIKEYQVD